MNSNGISVVICCHNAATRILPTLEHISKLRVDPSVSWEILIVDNASTDNTKHLARNYWAENPRPTTEFRIINEERLGVGHARYRGISEARYDYICYVDDDNWLDQDFLSIALNLMDSQPNAAACGSRSTAVFESPAPEWFDRYRECFAVGPQANHVGNITWPEGHLWTAGMILRKSAIQDLIARGFTPSLVGRTGRNSGMSSEDVEMCYALRLAGWSIWYLPELKFQHCITSSRLNWAYLRKLQRGVGFSYVMLIPYLLRVDGRTVRPGFEWTKKFLRACWELSKNVIPLIKSLLWPMEGSSEALKIERQIGLIKSLLINRRTFISLCHELERADWVDFEKPDWVVL